MKTFYILDHKWLPTPYNHRFFVEKFARGFSYRGFSVKVVKKLSEIDEPGYVMVSCHSLFFRTIFLTRLLRLDFTRFFKAGRLIPGSKSYLGGLPYSEGLLGAFAEVLQKIVLRRIAKKKRVVLVCWFWQNNRKFIESLGAPYLLTGEYYYGDPKTADFHDWREEYLSDLHSLPIKFSADVDPQKVGEGCSNDQYAVSFVGNLNYKPDYYGLYKERVDCKIVPTPPYISENERLDIYKKTKVNLGFHAQQNIENFCVVERVFEALAYGAICITDNPSAPGATDGCAQYVASKEDFGRAVDRFLGDDSARETLRNKGFEFARERGTYAHRAQEFLDRTSVLYGIKF